MTVVWWGRTCRSKNIYPYSVIPLLSGVPIPLIKTNWQVLGFSDVSWSGMSDLIGLCRSAILLAMNPPMLLPNPGTPITYFLEICRCWLNGIEESANNNCLVIIKWTVQRRLFFLARIMCTSAVEAKICVGFNLLTRLHSLKVYKVAKPLKL